jgi:hypothetical protein
MNEAHEASARIEKVLEELRSSPDRRAAPVAEELVGCLVRLYGAGLARIMAIVGPEGGQDLCDDPLVESLLLVHDLHPLDPDSRIRRAVERVRTKYDGTIHYRGLDADGVAHLNVEPRRGCGSPIDAVRQAIEEAAPEVASVDVEIVEAPLPLLQITRRTHVSEARGQHWGW